MERYRRDLSDANIVLNEDMKMKKYNEHSEVHLVPPGGVLKLQIKYSVIYRGGTLKLTLPNSERIYKGWTKSEKHHERGLQ